MFHVGVNYSVTVHQLLTNNLNSDHQLLLTVVTKLLTAPESSSNTTNNITTSPLSKELVLATTASEGASSLNHFSTADSTFGDDSFMSSLGMDIEFELDLTCDNDDRLELEFSLDQHEALESIPPEEYL